MAEWYSIANQAEQDRLVAAWRDAPVENAEVCAFILEAAQEQVIAYGPVLAEGEPVPNRWVYAQLQQAKNLLMAGSVARGGEYGEGEFTYEPRPLDKAIKNLIRPVDGKPHVL